MKRIIKFRAGYSSQIFVYDSANIEDMCSLDYSEIAYSQGYAMANGVIAFFTVTEDGLADFSIWVGKPALLTEYAKTAKARLVLTSGELCIQEPEEPPVVLSVLPGEYDVVFAQKKTDAEDFLEIDIFLDRPDGALSCSPFSGR